MNVSFLDSNSYDIKYTFSKFIYRLKWPARFVENVWSVVKWLPVIWKDRQFDGVFLLRMMEYKLGLMEKFFRTKNIISDREKVAKKIMICRVLCKRLAEEEYTTPWDKERTESAHRLWDYISGNKKEIGGGMSVYTSEGYVPSKELRRAADWANKREEEMIQQDIECLFTILKKNIRKFWD